MEPAHNKMSTKMNTTIEQNGDSLCASAYADVSNDALLTLGPKNRYSEIPSIRLFISKYHTYPCIFDCDTDDDGSTHFHATTILNYIRNELKHDITKDFVTRKYHRRSKQKYINSRFSDLGNGIVINFVSSHIESDFDNNNQLKTDYDDKYFLIVSELKILYLPEHDSFVQDLYDEFFKMTLAASKSCMLEMVCKNSCGYYLESVRIKKPSITELALHYGNAFLSTHEKILQNLNKKESKGIVLLHGVPGSGKTHYIRYLIQEVQDKTLIYVSPDMAKEIASPEFLPFLMRHENAILIIEDAENIIQDRNESSTPSQAVANLLNLSDGLLGDAMHQQIIATFNCDLTSVDPALLRKGRLIASHEFNKLDIETATILSDKLGFGTKGITEPMTLAEIYNQSEIDNQTIA